MSRASSVTLSCHRFFGPIRRPIGSKVLKLHAVSRGIRPVAQSASHMASAENPLPPRNPSCDLIRLHDFEIDNDNPQSRRRFFFLPLNELVVNLASSKLGNLEKIANFLRNASHSQGLEACGSSANSKPEKYQSAADRLRRWLSNSQSRKPKLAVMRSVLLVSALRVRCPTQRASSAAWKRNQRHMVLFKAYRFGGIPP
jgi:hypothetical protein